LIIALVFDDTGVVEILNVADVEPDATETKAGTTAPAWSLERVTEMPPTGAGPLRVIVPVDEAPPTTADGLTVTPVNASGPMERIARRLSLPRLADTVADTSFVTIWVETVKVACPTPAGMVTDAGSFTLD